MQAFTDYSQEQKQRMEEQFILFYSKNTKSGEVFRPIRDVDGQCFISNYGRVIFIYPDGFRAHEPSKDNMAKRYSVVNLYRNGQRKTENVHKLVAAAFLGECPKGYIIHHIDENRQNPEAANLVYLSRS